MGLYLQAKAWDSLVLFHEACAQTDIDDFRDYQRALHVSADNHISLHCITIWTILLPYTGCQLALMLIVKSACQGTCRLHDSTHTVHTCCTTVNHLPPLTSTFDCFSLP